MRKLSLIILGLVALMGGCKDPFKGRMYKAYEGQAVGLWLEARPEYSLWVAMLKKADLFNALNLGTQTFTCFVADNAAVEHYLATYTSLASVDEMTEEDAEYLMRYHIIAYGAISYGNMMLKLPLPTATGDYLTAGVDLATGGKYIDNGTEKPRSNIVERDIALANGVIHRLDNTLVPLTESIWDVLGGQSRYTLFAQAVEACGLDGWLSEVYRTVATGATTQVTIRANKTVFAVSDEVFASHGISGMADMRSMFGGDPADPNSEFYQWVQYHFMDRLNGYAELTTFPAGYRQMTIHGISRVKGVSVEDTGAQIIFNPQESDKSFRIIDNHRDIPAKNGYIHEIDNLMELPDRMAHFVVVWEPTDKFEFQAITGYRQTLGESSPVQRIMITDWGIEGFTWEAIPAVSATVWYQSDFIDAGRFMNHDALFWNMGNIGWFEITTPVLPMGKYKFNIEKSNEVGGGVCNVYWDDTSMGNDRNFATGTAYADWGDRDLASEEEHTLRFVTTTGGSFGIDRVVFTPVL